MVRGCGEVVRAELEEGEGTQYCGDISGPGAEVGPHQAVQRHRVAGGARVRGCGQGGRGRERSVLGGHVQQIVQSDGGVVARARAGGGARVGRPVRVQPAQRVQQRGEAVQYWYGQDRRPGAHPPPRHQRLHRALAQVGQAVLVGGRRADRPGLGSRGTADRG
ncbi:hypothetical protein [Streptomyces anulatus]|uniref:hypothetical protein n=1 Tax=Streptomyces anulatus TaxID=1892 RepID=UPI0022542359|nr:hypothetical protein [Streptomyces anulatus]MCX4508179.1 hypothetical protein [Streptomyces anulatus]